MSTNKVTLMSLEPPYSLYFAHVAEALTNIFSNSGVELEKKFVSVSNAWLRYLPGFNPISFWDVHSQFIPDAELISQVGKIHHLNNNKLISPDHQKLITFAQYAMFIEKIIDENPSCFFIVYNDLRWNHAIAIDVLRRQKVPFFVFERGVFRPYTTTVDCWGVNANANIVTEKLSVPHIWSNHRLGIARPKQKKLKLNFSLFFLQQKLTAFFLRRQRVALGGARRNLRYYFDLFLKQTLVRKIRKDNNHAQSVSERYIFIPLQLSDDTQTLINSRFSNTQEFICEVEDVFSQHQIFNGYQLIFKVHPMDCNQYKFNSESIVVDIDTKTLCQNASLVVTINSTVGFEAFCLGKKVVTFGDSFYTRKPFVYPYKKGNMDGLVDFMEDGEPSAATVAENIEIILKKYQAPGSVFEYDQGDLQEVASFIYKAYTDR